MRTIYIADDGKEFDDQFKCEHYEWILNHPYLKNIKCYDKDNNELKDIMEEDTYNYCHKIIVPTNETAKELNDLANYTGYCYYSHITEAGTWIYEENENGDSWEADESDEHYECPNCGSYFSYEREVSVSYYSSPVEKNEPLVIC